MPMLVARWEEAVFCASVLSAGRRRYAALPTALPRCLLSWIVLLLEQF
jgi:hypothetical protein